MHIEHLGGRHYAQFEKMGRLPGLVHGFSTRAVDVGMREDARAAERAADRRAMAVDLGLASERLCCCVQVHEGRIAIIESGEGPARREGFDGLITNVPGLGLMTFSADCPLVLVYDAVRRVVGLAHASWRCTVGRITQRLVEMMVGRFACDARTLYAGVGPSAGPEKYEVGPDVYDAAAGLPDRERCFPRRDGRMFFDLWQANRGQLERAGVPTGNIEVAGVCTMSDPGLFYSYRLEGTGCGHFGLMAAVREGRAG